MTATDRKRRTREQTREMLLDAALRVVLSRSPGGGNGAATNPLAGIRITEALDEVNRMLRESDPGAPHMTTGAVYNIWPTQEDFQMALLDRIVIDAAVPQIEEVHAVLEDSIADGVDWRELVARCFGTDFEVSFREPTMFVMIGVTALGSVEHIAELSELANARYEADTTALLDRILTYAGRTMVDGRTIADLVWAIEAAEAGYLLRRRMMPAITERADAAGRTVVEAALVALVEAFTESVEDKLAACGPRPDARRVDVV
jgi:AcrR family transcriptional regulator